ncbi:hypothetical protein Sme01_15370 [Sphaerisporangium melleum]|uniref:Uncharacterized protein n=1 Tax=Sphaerisporangium melleum TaxID=321316 RepID=A0A917VF85_9ACTN|nr:phospholipid carrier-dependent glycosyltransferase [Sphaerisporangium melleum]GGK69745.1 hypothetical protein GCM10007964_10970 [Sphaerisporangium melleum]GII69061.1 hypothetical protein Sme01_15370 [Sphaerisporangium melleum]
MVTVADPAQAGVPTPRRGARILGFLRQRRLFVICVTLGALLRLIAMLGYRPAMWFNDSYEYVSVALHPRPHPIRPDGYGFWLLILKPFHSFALVVFTQHLMGLATAVLVYALLRRKFGLPDWGATLATVPVLFDAYQIQLEQMIMSDSMFTLLIVGLVTLVLWHRRLSWRSGVAVGLLLALTALTRSIGLPILAVVVVFLLIKRTHWKPILAVVTACAVPVVAYMGWFSAVNGQFAMTQSDGLILYMRTAKFADCKKIKPDLQREQDLIPLCNNPNVERSEFSQLYLWYSGLGEVLHRWGTDKFDRSINDAAGKFARRAIIAQPGDYLSAVTGDLLRSFRWDRPVFPDANTWNQYQFFGKGVSAKDPERLLTSLPKWPSYLGTTDRDMVAYEQGRASTRVYWPWATVMERYQRVFFLPGLGLGLALLVGAAGVVARWRRLGGPALLPLVAASALVVAPAATAEFDYRYLLPAAPLAFLAAAIAVRHGLRPARRRPVPDEPAEQAGPGLLETAEPGPAGAAGAGAP